MLINQWKWIETKKLVKMYQNLPKFGLFAEHMSDKKQIWYISKFPLNCWCQSGFQIKLLQQIMPKPTKINVNMTCVMMTNGVFSMERQNMHFARFRRLMTTCIRYLSTRLLQTYFRSFSYIVVGDVLHVIDIHSNHADQYICIKV